MKKKKIEYIPLPYIGLFDLSLIYETSDTELLYKVLFKVNEIAKAQNVLAQDFEYVKQYVEDFIEVTGKDIIEKWLNDNAYNYIDKIIEDKIQPLIDEFKLNIVANRNYKSVIEENIIHTFDSNKNNSIIKSLFNTFYKEKFDDGTDILKLKTYNSYLGKEILCLYIGNQSVEKENIIVQYGCEHAKEIGSSWSLCKQIEYILNNLNNYTKNGKTVKELLKTTLLIFIPMQNVDGADLVVDGFNSIPTTLPDNVTYTYEELTRNIKIAIAEFISQNGIGFDSSFSISWWNSHINQLEYRNDRYYTIINPTTDEEKLNLYALMGGDELLELWLSNLEGTDLYLNKTSENIWGNLQSTSYTSGLYKCAYDYGISPFGAWENEVIEEIKPTFTYNIITYHTLAPLIEWNCQLKDEQYIFTNQIAKEISKYSNTNLSSLNYSQIAPMGTWANLSETENKLTLCLVHEIGYHSRTNALNETDNKVSIVYDINLTDNIRGFSPLNNWQEKYIDYNNTANSLDLLILMYSIGVLKRNFMNNILTTNYIKNNRKNIRCNVSPVTTSDWQTYGNFQLSTTSRLSYTRIGELVFLTGYLTITGDGTADVTTNRPLVIWSDDLPKPRNITFINLINLGLCYNNAKESITQCYIPKERSLIIPRNSNNKSVIYLNVNDIKDKYSVTLQIQIQYIAEE